MLVGAVAGNWSPLQHRPKDAATLAFVAGIFALGVFGCDADGAPREIVAPGHGGETAAGGAAATAAGGAAAQAEQAPPSALAAPVADAEQRAARTHRAARCGECHEKMHREWRESPHAHTADGELYRALRRASDASCDRCHEPLRTLGVADELARAEGVSCDVCHRIDRVEVRSTHAEAPLQLTGNT